MLDAYFSTSEDHESWGDILPTLRIWALEGGTETPLSDSYKLVSEIRPPNYDGGMLDGVRVLRLPRLSLSILTMLP